MDVRITVSFYPGISPPGPLPLLPFLHGPTDHPTPMHNELTCSRLVFPDTRYLTTGMLHDSEVGHTIDNDSRSAGCNGRLFLTKCLGLVFPGNFDFIAFSVDLFEYC